MRDFRKKKLGIPTCKLGMVSSTQSSACDVKATWPLTVLTVNHTKTSYLEKSCTVCTYTHTHTFSLFIPELIFLELANTKAIYTIYIVIYVHKERPF